jgi:hypothetical protein
MSKTIDANLKGKICRISKECFRCQRFCYSCGDVRRFQNLKPKPANKPKELPRVPTISARNTCPSRKPKHLFAAFGHAGLGPGRTSPPRLAGCPRLRVSGGIRRRYRPLP